MSISLFSYFNAIESIGYKFIEKFTANGTAIADSVFNKTEENIF